MNKKIKRFATTTIICVLVASIFGSVIVFAPAPDIIFPQLINAFITNTSSDPVPVDITDDTLTVTLDEPIDVTLDQPIEVKNILDFEPFTSMSHLALDPVGSPFTEDVACVVPEGKLLVIEYINAKMMWDSANEPLCRAFVVVYDEWGSTEQSYPLPVYESGTDYSTEGQVSSEMVKIYVKPGYILSTYLCRYADIDSSIVLYCQCSGYLIDAS